MFTKKSLWVGGTDGDNGPTDSFTVLRQVLERKFELSETREMPFLLKETRRNHQWTVALCSVWRIK